MAINEIKCKNCGAILDVQDDVLICSQCGTKYVMKDDINNNYVTNNETIIKNYYGRAATEEKNKEKIKDYLKLAVSNFNVEHYADAKDRLNRVLNKDPSNLDAQIILDLISKGPNGRYISPSSAKYKNAAIKWLNSDNPNSASYLPDVLYCGLRRSVLSLGELRDLEERFVESDLGCKGKFVELLQRSRKSKIIWSCISWSIVMILCLIFIFSARNGCTSKNGNSNSNKYYSAMYYASDGGYIYSQKRNTNYSNYYGFDVAKGKSGETVIANPDIGYKFSRWSDGYTDAVRVDKNVQGAISVTAYFVRDNHYVTITYSAQDGGSIIGALQQTILINGNCSAVVAIAINGYKFSKWSDGLLTSRRQDINVQSSQTFYALFEKVDESETTL